jgi:hypothetical protein
MRYPYGTMVTGGLDVSVPDMHWPAGNVHMPEELS